MSVETRGPEPRARASCLKPTPPEPQGPRGRQSVTGRDGQSGGRGSLGPSQRVHPLPRWIAEVPASFTAVLPARPQDEGARPVVVRPIRCLRHVAVDHAATCRTGESTGAAGEGEGILELEVVVRIAAWQDDA